MGPEATSYFFDEALQKETNIPIINMIQQAIEGIVEQFGSIQKIGLMSTTGTIQTKIYHNEATKYGIELITPSKKRQRDVMSLIYDEIKEGKVGNPKKFYAIYDELIENGSQVVILACTELSVFKKKCIKFLTIVSMS